LQVFTHSCLAEVTSEVVDLSNIGKESLSGKTKVLVSHELQRASEATPTPLFRRGCLTYYGKSEISQKVDKIISQLTI